MKRHIRVYVKNDLFPGSVPPPKTNKRFCPSNTTIKNHMHIAVIKQRLEKVDQANLKEKIMVWQNENEGDLFEFRPYVDPKRDDLDTDRADENSLEDEDDEIKVDDGTSNNGLLFVHQTNWQRRLLQRYGNELSSGCHLQNNQVPSTTLLSSCKNKLGVQGGRFFRYTVGNN